MNNKIIVVNDDGVNAIGIDFLAKAMMKYGEVIVYSPSEEQSAKSGAATFFRRLNVKKIEGRVYECYSVDGTPADCVRVATARHKDINFVASGINNGHNIGVDSHYSGTIGAAIEANLHGVSSFAFSSPMFEVEDAPIHLDEIIKKALEVSNTYNGKMFCINVNIPSVKKGYNGFKFTKVGFFVDDIIGDEKDGTWYEAVYNHGYDLTDHDIDYVALEDGFVSITPLTIDMTDYQKLNSLK